jgi:hypothetical protein
MKILDILKHIILEDKRRSDKPKLFTTPEGVKFFSSKHHTKDRKTYLSYKQIKDIILNAIDSGVSTHTRVGVPNVMISELIRKKYKKILDEFSKDPKEEKIKFVFKRDDTEGDEEEVFDYIEIILGRDYEDKNTFNVASSTFSSNGNYLGLFGKDVVQARKVILEKYFHLRTVLL